MSVVSSSLSELSIKCVCCVSESVLGEFDRWLDCADLAGKLLWLHGHQGAGKSHVAAVLARR